MIATLDLTFSASAFLAEKTSSINPYESSNSTYALASMFMQTGNTSATQEVASSTRHEMANDEQEVTVNKVTEPAAGIVTEISTVPCLPFSSQ